MANGQNSLGQLLNYGLATQEGEKDRVHQKQIQVMKALLDVENKKNALDAQATRDSSLLANQQFSQKLAQDNQQYSDSLNLDSKKFALKLAQQTQQKSDSSNVAQKRWQSEQLDKAEQRALEGELRNKQMILDHEKFITKMAESQRHIDAERKNQHQLDMEKQRAEIEENYMIKHALFNQTLAERIARQPNKEYRFSELGMSSALNNTPEGEETSGFLNMLWDADMTDYINAGRGFVEGQMGELGKRDVNDAQVQKAIKALAKLYKKGNVEGYVSDVFFDDNKEERNVLSQVVELMKDLGMTEEEIYKEYGRPIWMDAK
jgi:hypothetical protein